MVRVVTSPIRARSSIVTPAPRAFSISRRIVHWRMTSAFRGTPAVYRPQGAATKTRSHEVTMLVATSWLSRRGREALQNTFVGPGLHARPLEGRPEGRPLRHALSVQRDAAQQVEVRQHLARAEDHRRQRILRELHRQA